MAPSVMLAVIMYVFGTETLVFWGGPEFAPGGIVLMVLLTAMMLGMAELTSSAGPVHDGPPSHHRLGRPGGDGPQRGAERNALLDRIGWNRRRHAGLRRRH